MEKIKIILLLAMLTGVAFHLPAQTWHYTSTRELKGNEYTYQCDLQGGDVTLYNKENKFTYKDQTLKDGSSIPDELYTQLAWGQVVTIEDDNWTCPKCYSIVENALSEYRNTIKGSALSVTLLINSEDGKIMEVYFNFAARGGFGTVPVSVFREMELKFKKEVYFNIADTGKKLNYNMISWTETY